MYFDISALDAPRSYKLLTATVVPRPIAWVVSADVQGRLNAAPFSFFNCFGGHPPVVCVGVGNRSGSPKDTLANIQARREFVVNLVPEALAAAMNDTATDFPQGHDELQITGLATAPSRRVGVPRIAASPVALECTLKQVIPIDRNANIVIAEVVAVHVADEAVRDAERCHIDTAELQLIGRMQSPGGYTRTRDSFSMRQVDFDEWQATRSPTR
ncbi:MAG TPA: flavin reductase family protein [Burkholderiaceae bacterium]|nr:flavin reductase family protein [Burkholderiaceae bacterium]